MSKRKITLLNDKAVLLTLDDEHLALLRQCVPQSAQESEDAVLNGESGYQKDVLYRPNVVFAILTNVARGLTRAAAAELAGVSAGTLYQWTQKHPELAQALARAEAVCEERLLSIITNAFEKHPRLALEVLERRLPKSWAPQMRTEHTGTVLHGVGSPEWFQRISEARLRRDQAAGLSGPARPLEITAGGGGNETLAPARES